MTRSLWLVAALALAVGVFGDGVLARQQTTASTELLTEVRLLRQAIEGLAGTNARVQIVFGRLQLQDQRTAAAVQRLDTVRMMLGAATQRVTAAGDRIRELEEFVTDSRRPPEQIEALRHELNGARVELSRAEADRARMAAEEVDLAGALNNEQGRWSDLNRQLDELERALTAKPR
jgi:chromosome segregation ATPase